VVIFAATFVQRDELRALSDEVIYLDSEPSVATARGIARDAAALGGVEPARQAYHTRYHRSQRPLEPTLVRIGSAG
jgi:uridine kinase